MRHADKTTLGFIKSQLAALAQPSAYLDPVTFARQRLGFIPDAWQEQVPTSTSPRLVMNICRQAGKSTISAILALHQALYSPGSLILLVSPSLRQSAELFRKVGDFLALLPVHPSLTEDNRLSLRFTNRSRIVSLPAAESRVRGFSAPALVIEDESARVPDDLYLTIRPMFSTNQGRHILMSTPHGQRGHFHEIWMHGTDWEKVCITAAQCPRISASFLAAEKASMPSGWYASEYECTFGETEDSVFRHEDVLRMLSDEVVPLVFPGITKPVARQAPAPAEERFFLST
jgi:hypothetical protein